MGYLYKKAVLSPETHREMRGFRSMCYVLLLLCKMSCQNWFYIYRTHVPGIQIIHPFVPKLAYSESDLPQVDRITIVHRTILAQ